MNTKKDFNNKIEEIMDILREHTTVFSLDNEISKLDVSFSYEKRLNRIAEKCGNLNAMVESSNLMRGKI